MNNFDQSSSGLNIEVIAHLDTDLSRVEFEENFERDERLEDHFQFVGYGNHNSIDLLDVENYKFTKKEFISMMFHFEEEDYIRSNYNGSFSKASKDDIVNYWDQYLSSDFNAVDIIEYYIDHLNPRFEVLTVNGYSQGDVLNVILSHNAIEEYNFDDRDTFLSSMSEHFENLAFRCPVHAKLEIDNGEFYLCEYLTNVYDWEKDQVLTGLSKDKTFTSEYTKEQQTYILTWLDENLNTELDYI